MAADRPRYLPFTGDGSRLRMGLRPLDLRQWVEVDEDFDVMWDEQRAVLDSHHHEVIAVAEQGDRSTTDACSELLDVLAQHLAETEPQRFTLRGDWVEVAGHDERIPWRPAALEASGQHPIEAAGRLTQEDWCVQMPDPSGVWRLAAASVCFPTRWVLGEKIGRSMRVVHDPVTGYESQLADPVDRFFDQVGVDRPRWRANWNLMDDPTLFQPGGKFRTTPSSTLRPDTAGDRVWLRVERQTLRRLPRTGAVVFGIRIHQDPLSTLSDRPDDLARLAATIESLPAGSDLHKSIGVVAPAVLSWIADRVGRTNG